METPDYIKRMAYEDIILKKRFIEFLKGEGYGYETIHLMYKITPITIEKVYEVIPEKMRRDIEEELDKTQIDLEEYAQKWIRKPKKQEDEKGEEK